MFDPVTYGVTGAAGQLGRRVVAALARRAPPASIVALVRDPAAAAGLFPEGVVVRQADYEQPATLEAAFAGIDRLLLISSNAVGQRMGQHRNVVEAAVAARVGRLAYTSLLRADTSPLGLADEHRATETVIAASGLDYTLLRNGWYTENYLAAVPSALQHGALIGAAGDGRIAGATRADYAEAAAAALVGDVGAAVLLELAGDEAWTLHDFAAELSRQTGRTIPYVDMPEAGYREALVGAGVPEPFAALLANSDAGAARDGLFDSSRTLSRLIGRPTTSLATAMAAALVEAPVAG